MTIDDYLVEHGSREDLERLGGLDARGRQQVAARLSTASWISSFLERDRPGALAAARVERYAEVDPEVLSKADQVLRVLLEHGEPWSLFDAWESFVGCPIDDDAVPEDAEARAFAEALHFLLSEALVLIGVDDGLDPFIGIWPASLNALRRRREVASLEIELESEPEETWQGCLNGDDLTVLLTECASEPPRVKSNRRELFARSSRALQDRLAAVPEWVREVGVVQEAEDRVDRAVAIAQMLGFVQARGRAGKDLRLVLTGAGREWMSADAKQRVRELASIYRNDGDDPAVDEDLDPDLSEEVLEEIRANRSLLPYRPYHYYLWNVDFRTPALDAFRSVSLDDAGESAWLDVQTFFQRHAAHNPIEEHLDTEKIDWLGEEQVHRMWVTVLASLLFDRFVGLGAVELGRTGERLAFRLLSLSGFVLRLADDFNWQSTESEAHLIVQPNFEIVFLGPSPSAAHRVASVAEGLPAWDQGAQVGTLFQVTRASVHRALSSGRSADQIVEELAHLSSQPLPGNVEQQIRTWSTQLHWGRARRTTVLAFDQDPQGAALALGALGKAARLLSDTVVELDRQRITESQRRKLREAGVFLDEEGEGENEPKGRKRPRR